MGQLDGRTAIVTGAGRGIGEAIARELDRAGARLVLLDLDLASAQALASELSSATARETDVSDYGQVVSAVSDIDRIDIVVNNAGWDTFQRFADNKPELWDKLIAVNLKGPINVCHAALPKMGPDGRIINIASEAARVGSRGEAVYSACKGGVISFTKSLAREIGRRHISVNCVSPGPTETPMMQEFLRSGGQSSMDAVVAMTPMGRMATVEEIAQAVLFFASGPGFVTGQILSVSGGVTMAG